MKFIILFITPFCTYFNGYNQTVLAKEKSDFPEIPFDSLISEIQGYKHFTAKIPADTVNYDKIEKRIFYVNYDDFDTFKDSIQALLKKNHPTLFVLDYSKSNNITVTDILKIYRLFNQEYLKSPSNYCKLFVPNIFTKFEKELIRNETIQSKVMVKITKKGHLFIENEEMDLKRLKLKLKYLVETDSLKTITISAEVGTPFKKITDIMNVANSLHLRCVLATDSK